MPNSLFECIEDKRNSILEGKTISSKQAQKSNNITEGTKTVNSVKTINEKVDRKTFKQMTEALKELNSKVNAYKIREQNINRIISSQNSQIDEYKALIENCNTQISQAKKAKALADKKLTQTKSNISKLTVENKQLRDEIRIKDNNSKDLDYLAEKVENTQQENNRYKSQIKSLNDKIRDLTEQLNRSKDVIKNYQSENEELTEELSRTSEQYDEELHKVNLQVSSLMSESDAKTQKINRLIEQIDTEQKATDSITEKYNRVTQQNKSLRSINTKYLNKYLNEYAGRYGIDPNNVKPLLKENATVEDVKQIVDTIRDKQDRYSKLPISYNKPTTINVLKENITNNNAVDEDKDTLKFLTDVKNNL